MAYADDTVLIARREENLRTCLKNWKRIEKTPGTNENKKMKIIAKGKELRTGSSSKI